MLTEAEIQEFYISSQRRQARRFLPDPETVTGFGELPMDYATQHGREKLIQSHDFERSETRPEAAVGEPA